MATDQRPRAPSSVSTASQTSLKESKSPPTAASSVGASPPPTNVTENPLNGDSTTSQPPKRPGIGTRLSRMFSRGQETVGASGGGALDGSKDKKAQTGGGAILEAPKEASDSDDHANRPSASRQGSTTLKPQPGPERSMSHSPDKGATGAPKSMRFTLNADGTHEHLLRSDKRQDKLSDVFRAMLGKKKEGDSDIHQLSLVSNWVDQIKSEKVAGDEKMGPNSAHSLVEKYGKCSEVVGRGAFGIVRISHKTDHKDPSKEQLYAVKEFRRRPSESAKKYNKRLTSEFCISSALRHPNVIHTLDLMKDAKGDFCEVMEFCAGGDLYSLVLAATKLEVVEADCFFKQLMRGVEYIHEMGVAHRDLKPENLLLTTHGSLKITDFGNGECFRMAWETEPHMVAGLCGSAPYIAPEEYIDQEFDPRAVDVWACGVIYMAMRTGRHLWRIARKDEDEFYERYLEGRRDEDGYSPIETLHRARCRNVIYSILDPNPGRRITASQVLKSEWGREIKLCKAGEEGY